MRATLTSCYDGRKADGVHLQGHSRYWTVVSVSCSQDCAHSSFACHFVTYCMRFDAAHPARESCMRESFKEKVVCMPCCRTRGTCSW